MPNTTGQPTPPTDFGRTPTDPNLDTPKVPILPVDPLVVSNSDDTTGGNRQPFTPNPVPTGPEPVPVNPE